MKKLRKNKDTGKYELQRNLVFVGGRYRQPGSSYISFDRNSSATSRRASVRSNKSNRSIKTDRSGSKTSTKKNKNSSASKKQLGAILKPLCKYDTRSKTEYRNNSFHHNEGEPIIKRGRERWFVQPNQEQPTHQRRPRTNFSHTAQSTRNSKLAQNQNYSYYNSNHNRIDKEDTFSRSNAPCIPCNIVNRHDLVKLPRVFDPNLFPTKWQRKIANVQFDRISAENSHKEESSTKLSKDRTHRLLDEIVAKPKGNMMLRTRNNKTIQTHRNTSTGQPAFPTTLSSKPNPQPKPHTARPA